MSTTKTHVKKLIVFRPLETFSSEMRETSDLLDSCLNAANTSSIVQATPAMSTRHGSVLEKEQGHPVNESIIRKPSISY